MAQAGHKTDLADSLLHAMEHSLRAFGQHRGGFEVTEGRREMTGKNRIMIFGPKDDGSYVVEFRTADGEVLSISIPRNETRSRPALPGADTARSARAGRGRQRRALAVPSRTTAMTQNPNPLVHLSRQHRHRLLPRAA
jgi:hypothetical protein